MQLLVSPKEWREILGDLQLSGTEQKKAMKKREYSNEKETETGNTKEHKNINTSSSMCMLQQQKNRTLSLIIIFIQSPIIEEFY